MQNVGFLMTRLKYCFDTAKLKLLTLPPTLWNIFFANKLPPIHYFKYGLVKRTIKFCKISKQLNLHAKVRKSKNKLNFVTSSFSSYYAYTQSYFRKTYKIFHFMLLSHQMFYNVLEVCVKVTDITAKQWRLQIFGVPHLNTGR